MVYINRPLASFYREPPSVRTRSARNHQLPPATNGLTTNAQVSALQPRAANAVLGGVVLGHPVIERTSEAGPTGRKRSIARRPSRTLGSPLVRPPRLPHQPRRLHLREQIPQHPAAAPRRQLAAVDAVAARPRRTPSFLAGSPVSVPAVRDVMAVGPVQGHVPDDLICLGGRTFRPAVGVRLETRTRQLRLGHSPLAAVDVCCHRRMRS